MAATTKGLIVMALAIGLRAGTAAAADDAGTAPMQQMMGREFQVVARVLTDLINARYGSIPRQAEIMIQHATQLVASPPISLHTASDRAEFLAYATNLRLAASELQTVTETLAKRDSIGIGPGGLSLDYLRASAARRLGDIVTACAICHSRFRQQPL